MASQIPALPQSYTPGTDSVFSDQSGFYSLDSNVPGLSKVILNKLNLKDYGEYRFPIFIFSSFFPTFITPRPGWHICFDRLCVRNLHKFHMSYVLKSCPLCHFNTSDS